MRSWRRAALFITLLTIITLIVPAAAGALTNYYMYPGDFKRADQYTNADGYFIGHTYGAVNTTKSVFGNVYELYCPLNLAVGKTISYARTRWSASETGLVFSATLYRVQWGYEPQAIADFLVGGTGVNTGGVIKSGTLSMNDGFGAADLVISSTYKYYYQVYMYSGVNFFGVRTAYY